MTSAIAISRERVLEVARAVRRSRRAYASVLMLFAVGLGEALRGIPGAQMALMAVGFALAGRQWWLATDAQRAFTLAHDPAVTWSLAERSVVASDAHGAVRVDASFHLTRGQYAALIAPPRAELRP